MVSGGFELSRHIPAEPGRLYLMTDGRRVRVTVATAHQIYFDIGPDPIPGWVPRSIFEAQIESVLS